MSIHYFIGPLLALLAFWAFGRGMINKSKGKPFRILLAFLLLLVAVAFRFFQSNALLIELYSFVGSSAGIFDRFCLMLFDLGVGMSLASLYLRVHKEQTKLFLVPGLLALFLSGVIYLAISLVNAITQPNRAAKTELLVELGPDDSIGEISPILDKYFAEYEEIFTNVSPEEDPDLAQYYKVWVDTDLSPMLIRDLRRDVENVDDVSENHPVSLPQPIPGNTYQQSDNGFLANDPFLAQQWHANKLTYNQVYEFLKEAQPKQKTKLAIVDTGVDGAHEDIKGVFRKSPGNKDFHSHGTHCAGIAAAATNNGKGIGSLNWDGKYIDVAGYHALDRYGRGTDASVAQAIIDAAEGGADVISMSLGGYHPRPPRVQKEAVEYALKLGAIVVVAAGNSSDDARKYSPANIPGVIVVAAVNQSFSKAPFSNTNTKLKMPIAAPGVDILSSTPSDKYQSFSGTSMATPMVAGLISIMRSFQPELTPKEAWNALEQTGTQVKDSPKVGNVINPMAAIQAVQ